MIGAIPYICLRNRLYFSLGGLSRVSTAGYPCVQGAAQQERGPFVPFRSWLSPQGPAGKRSSRGSAIGGNATGALDRNAALGARRSSKPAHDVCARQRVKVILASALTDRDAGWARSPHSVFLEPETTRRWRRLGERPSRFPSEFGPQARKMNGVCGWSAGTSLLALQLRWGRNRHREALGLPDSPPGSAPRS